MEVSEKQDGCDFEELGEENSWGRRKPLGGGACYTPLDLTISSKGGWVGTKKNFQVTAHKGQISCPQRAGRLVNPDEHEIECLPLVELLAR